MFRKYEKIIRLGKDETVGILDGTCYIQEKIDGANASVWLEDGEIQCGSRNRHLVDDDFNGFVTYAKEHPGIIAYLKNNPTCRLYGEWLVKHTISYNEDAYKKFYLFDVHNGDEFLHASVVAKIANDYGISTPRTHAVMESPSVDEVKKYLEVSYLGVKAEGVVIKNHLFINSFGDKVYGKIVTDQFREDASIKFGGNDKHADSYWEIYVMQKYVTTARVKKVCDKLQPMVNERLDMKHIPRINEMVWHDLLQEEIYEISKKAVSLDFKTCKRLCAKKTKELYVELLNKSGE